MSNVQMSTSNTNSQPPSAVSLRPKCPTIWYIDETGQPAPTYLNSLKLDVEFHISTAIVHLVGSWTNPSSKVCDCLFALPMFGTVTNVEVTLASGRVFSTMVVPTDEYKGKHQKPVEPAGPQSITPSTDPYEEYIPHLFRLPLNAIGPKETITVSVQYLEPLTYGQGNFHFLMPLSIQRININPNLLEQNCILSQIVQISLSISVDRQLQFQCGSHQLQPPSEEVIDGMKRVIVKTVIPPDINPDLDFSYSLISEKIHGTLLLEEQKKDDGNFLLFISPPTQVIPSRISRIIVFMLDRSGSMTGQPYKEATRAVTTAVSQLTESDYFTIIAFDHRQEYFRDTLIAATDESKEYAALWLQQVSPEYGTTEILTPLDWSVKIVHDCAEEQRKSKPFVLSMPIVVLITDGCVQNEREICSFVHGNITDVRLMSLGIGSYCNWFFLKMASQIGRGFSDVVVFAEHIYPQVMHLLEMSNTPLLTDVAVGIQGISNCEIYPFPIPDLYAGSPLIISGHYSGTFPNVISVEGKLPSGKKINLPINARKSSMIPVSKVFLKQRLDLLTAKAWLEESSDVKEEVIEMSCENSMPCAYTSMVSFETTKEEKEKLDIEGEKAKNKRKYNMKAVGAIAIAGGLVVVGAALFSFGDAGASLANTPVGDVLGIGGDGCDCGECGGDCDCGDCGDCDCGDCGV